MKPKVSCLIRLIKLKTLDKIFVRLRIKEGGDNNERNDTIMFIFPIKLSSRI